MDKRDKVIETNKSLWDQEAAKGGRWSSPWLDLDRKALAKYGRGEDAQFDLPVRRWELLSADGATERLMKGVKGKNVLCLASGGGQQSAVYGLLGATVTVLDISRGQLDADVRASDRYGYDLTVVQGDMCDLSMFSDNTFDVVEQPISICFVPDVRKVYREVFRVLKPGGLYRVGHVNPAVYPASFEGGHNGWDGVGYRIAEPYVGGAVRKTAGGIENMLEGTPTGEFRHLLSDMFNGLLEVGLEIRNVTEDLRHTRPAQDAQPGTEAHRAGIIAEYLIILAEKRRN